jgi:flagellar basal-body rod modification protein FlgD
VDVTPTTVAGAYTPPQSATQSALAGLGEDGFLQLLVAQLRYQSPMNPTDPSAMMQQTSQLASVETLKQVATMQSQLLGMQQTSLATGLIGREVVGTTADGAEVTGTVDAVRFGPTGPLLLVGDREVPMGAATELRGAVAATTATTPSPDTTA